MKPSFLRIMLIVLAGGYITIMGYAPYASNPLLVLTGASLVTYGLVMFMAGDNLMEVEHSRTAHPCQNLNHAGCQDNPECACGCHRERIEISVGS